ncbi:transposase [Streptomyces sp. NPDC012637]|uniref:transposase n=1 Tax=Streptomyces sp. NPDC012637 TaxID=3364842 RepID=UPI0036EA4F76
MAGHARGLPALGPGLRLLPGLARPRHGQGVPRPAPRRVREQAGRDAVPSAGVIESQSIKADAVVGAGSRGFDGGKLIIGRKRHAVVDTPGLLLGVMVTAADFGDCTAGQVLLARVAAAHHRLAWSGVTAATPAASSGTAWPSSPWCWRLSNALTTCVASWCCPSGGSWSGSSPT